MYLRGEYGRSSSIAEGYQDYRSPGIHTPPKYAGSTADHKVDPPICFDPDVLLGDVKLQLSDEHSGIHGHELRDLFAVEIVTQSETGSGRGWAKQLAGTPLAWSSLIRFRHLCSNRHLMLNENGLTLSEPDDVRKNNTEDWSTVFEIKRTSSGAIEPSVKYDSRFLFKSADPDRPDFLMSDPASKSFNGSVRPALITAEHDHRKDVFVLEKVNPGDAQDLRSLLYMREALRTFITSLRWSKGEAKWQKTTSGAGSEIVGDRSASWDLSIALRESRTSRSSRDRNLAYQKQVISTVVESLKRLRIFASQRAGSSKAVTTYATPTANKQRQKQLMSTVVLDMAVAIALLPGEWLLNSGSLPTVWKTNAGAPVVGLLHEVTVEAHRLSRLIMSGYEPAARYMFDAQISKPLSRQLNWAKSRNDVFGGWDVATSSKESIETMQCLLQGDMIDEFKEGMLTNQFAKIFPGAAVQSTINKYRFLVAVVKNGKIVKKQQRWIVKEITNPQNARFLPAPLPESNQIRIPAFDGTSFQESAVEKSDDSSSSDKSYDCKFPDQLKVGNFLEWAQKEPDPVGNVDAIAHQLYYVYCELCSFVAYNKNFFCQNEIAKIFSVRHLVTAISEPDLPNVWKGIYLNLLLNVHVVHREHSQLLIRRTVLRYGGERVRAKLAKLGSTEFFSNTKQLDYYEMLDFTKEDVRIEHLRQRGSPLFTPPDQNGLRTTEWKKLKQFLLNTVQEVARQNIQTDSTGAVFFGFKANVVHRALTLTKQFLTMGLLCDWDASAMADGKAHGNDSMKCWVEANKSITVTAKMQAGAVKLKAIKMYMECLDLVGILDNNRRMTRLLNFFSVAVKKSSEIWFSRTDQGAASEIGFVEDATRDALEKMLQVKDTAELGDALGNVLFRESGKDTEAETEKRGTARALLQVLLSEDPDLTSTCLKLLHRLYSQKKRLRRDIQWATIVTPKESEALSTVQNEQRVYLQPIVDFAFGQVFSSKAQRSLDYFEAATAFIRRWFSAMDPDLKNEDQVPLLKVRMDTIYRAYRITKGASKRYPDEREDGDLPAVAPDGSPKLAERVVSESPCAAYIFNTLLDLARLLQNVAVRDVEVDDQAPLVVDEALDKSGRFRRKDGNTKFIRCTMVKYFASACVNFLEQYAKINKQNQAIIRNMVLDETVRSKKGRKSALTLFLLDMIAPDEMEEGLVVAKLMMEMYRDDVRAASTLRVEEAVVLRELFLCSATHDPEEEKGVVDGVTGDVTFRPGYLLVIVELLRTLPVGSPAGILMQAGICDIMFPLQDAANAVMMLRDLYDPQQHLNLMIEYASVFEEFEKEKEEFEKQKEKANDKFKTFRAWQMTHAEGAWSEMAGGQKIRELLFYHRLLIICGYICRGNDQKIRAIEEKLRPWLGRRAEKWNEQKTGMTKENGDENSDNEAEVGRAFLNAFVLAEVPPRIIAYKGPALRCLQEIFLEGQELQDQLQARREQRASNESVPTEQELGGQEDEDPADDQQVQTGEDDAPAAPAEDSTGETAEPDELGAEVSANSSGERAGELAADDSQAQAVEDSQAQATESLFDEYIVLVQNIGTRVIEFSEKVQKHSDEIEQALETGSEPPQWYDLAVTWKYGEMDYVYLYIFPFIEKFFMILLGDDEETEAEHEATELMDKTLSSFGQEFRTMFKSGGTFSVAMEGLSKRGFVGWRTAPVRQRFRRLLLRVTQVLKIDVSAVDALDAGAGSLKHMRSKNSKVPKHATAALMLQEWEDDPVLLTRRWNEFLRVIPSLDHVKTVDGDGDDDASEQRTDGQLQLARVFRSLVEQAMGFGELETSSIDEQKNFRELGFKQDQAKEILKRLFTFMTNNSGLGKDAETNSITHGVQLDTARILAQLMRKDTWTDDDNFFERQGITSDPQLHLDAVAKLLGEVGAIKMIVINVAMCGKHGHVLQYVDKVELLGASVKLAKMLSDKCNKSVQDNFFDYIRTPTRVYDGFFLNGVCSLLSYYSDQIVSVEDDTGMTTVAAAKSAQEITVILGMLQNFCDGQNIDMQNLMSEQPAFGHQSENVLLHVADCMERVVVSFQVQFGQRNAQRYGQTADSYMFSYKGERVASNNDLYVGKESFRKRSLIRWMGYSKDDVVRQTILMRVLTAFYSTLTDFFEGPNRKMVETLRRSTRVGLCSARLLPYLGSRLLPSDGMARIGYDGSSEDGVCPTVFYSQALSASCKLQRRTAVAGAGTPQGFPIEIQELRMKHRGPIWMDDPITYVALDMQNKMIEAAKTAFEEKDREWLAKMKKSTRIGSEPNRISKRYLDAAVDRTTEEEKIRKELVKAASSAVEAEAESLKEQFDVWRLAVGTRQNLCALMREFARLEMAILDLALRLLEGNRDRDTVKYLHQIFDTKNEMVLVNMQMHMLHSQLKTRHHMPEDKAQKVADKKTEVAGALLGAVEFVNPMTKDEADDGEDEADDGEDAALQKITSPQSGQGNFEMWKKWLARQTSKRKMEQHGSDIMGMHEGDAEKFDNLTFRLKYFVLAEAMGEGRSSFNDKLKWFSSFESDSLLTQSFVAQDGIKRPTGGKLGLVAATSADRLPPRKIIADFCYVELQRTVGSKSNADHSDAAELERIYFLKPRLFQRFDELTDREKTSLKKEWCSTGNLEEQLTSFVTGMKSLISEAEHRQNQVKKVSVIPLLQSLLISEHGVGWTALLIAISINLLLCMSYRYSKDHAVEVDEFGLGTEQWLQGLAYLHCAFSWALLLQFYLLKQGFEIQNAIAEKEKVGFRFEFRLLQKIRVPRRIWELYYFSISPIWSFEATYVSVYVFASVFGAFGSKTSFFGQDSRFIYATHLFDVCRRAEVLATVLSVVSTNAEQLLVTLGLGVIVIYMYSVLGFLFLHDQYAFDDKQGCNYLYECLLLHLDYGFRSAPSYIGDGAPMKCTGDHRYPDCEFEVAESLTPFLFDFTYYLLVILILVAIITGIIIDSFSSRRADDEERIDHLQNKCFICGKGRGEFESLGIDFEEHQKTQHGIWNYFAFLMSLHTRARNEEDFLASEFFVWKQFESGNIEFFPMRRSIQIEELKSKDEDGVSMLKKKFDKFAGTVSGMQRSQNELKTMMMELLKKVDTANANVLQRNTDANTTNFDTASRVSNDKVSMTMDSAY